MSWWWIVGIAVMLLAAIGWWLQQRKANGGAVDDDGDRLDTLAAWPPSATRVLTSAERLGYGVLVRAVPGHMVLAQVPLARFLKVPTRHSYSEWLRRLGNQCADLLVCDMATEVIAVVTIEPPADRVSERSRKRHLRMARVLKKAGIALHVWTDGALPSVEAAREMILPQKTETTAATPAVAPPPRTQERVTGPTPFDDSARDSSNDDLVEVREPPPSTWFDEFNSGPAPLQSRNKPR